MPLSELAHRRWLEIWAVVDRDRVRPELHGDTVAIYCVAYAAWAEACHEIATAGVLTKSGDRANPYVAVRDRSAKLLLRLSPELGLSPGSGSIVWPTKRSP
jgi:P27 family predicted phage terminase small subunit